MAYYDTIYIPDADIPTVAAVSNKSSSYPLVAADTGTYFTTTGAAGAVTFTLPEDPDSGFFCKIHSTTSNQVIITCQGSDKIYSMSNTSGTGFTSINQTFIGAHALVAYIGGNRWISQDYAAWNATP